MTDLFTKVPHWLIRESDLDGSELLLYLAMLSRADKKGLCFPSVSTLAKEARMSPSSVRRTRERLIEKGLVTVTRRKLKDKRNDSNLYHVALPKRGGVKFADSSPETDVSPEPVDNFEPEPPKDVFDIFGEPFSGVTVEPSWCHGDRGDGVTVTGEEEPVKEQPLKKTLSPQTPSFEFTDLGITEAQWWLLSDLFIHITGKKADQRTQNDWGALTSEDARDLIRRFYANVGRDDDYTGPDYGTPAYLALTDRGKEWADAGMVPDNYSIGDAA